MKRYMKYIIIVVTILLIGILVVVVNQSKKEKEDDGKFKIVTSFYPIYIMTANITQGAENIELVNMSETNIGCVHNYTLNTEDMKEIENAEVFIQNGLGLESFIEKITVTNRNLQVIDTSENITNLIEENNEINPHIWTSLSNYIKQVENISNALIEKNPENADVYKTNTETYIQKINDLKLRYDTELLGLKGKSAVCLNESFEYLGKEVGLNLITVHTDHEESTMSAEMLKNIINEIREDDIRIIIVDINDDLKNAQTIANETGATIYKLDSALTGSLDKESYLNSMSGNLVKLQEAMNQ